MKTVACVLKIGGRYDRKWVERLARDVRRHMSEPYRFVCLTDDLPWVSSEIVAVPLVHGWRGWWSKLELLRPGLFDGPVLYIDLDSLIVGPLAPLFSDRFTMVRDFVGGSRGWCNSCAMAWTGDVPGPYEAFRRDPEAGMVRTGDGRMGDQAFIEDHSDPDTFAPGLVVSYRMDALDGPPPGASVVQFHGTPKPADAGGWAERVWSANDQV